MYQKTRLHLKAGLILGTTGIAPQSIYRTAFDKFEQKKVIMRKKPMKVALQTRKYTFAFVNK